MSKKRKAINAYALKAITIEELDLNVVVRLWSYYHQKSVAHMLVIIDTCLRVHLLFQKLVGQKGCAKITSSFNVVKQPNGSTQKCHYENITRIKEL